MALKIVTGGTTGAADGTAASQGGAFTNPLVIVALNTAVDAHIRCDDGYWSADQSFDVPTGFEVSFDGGSTWYDNADEPITAPEIYAVNVPIKIRQTVAAGSTSGSFVTDGTYTAIAALSTPTLTCTVVGTSQIDLSWTNVSNEDASPGYTIERSPDGSSWSALTTKAANVTTHSDTGLTTGTHYYYRVRAEGSGRYSDSGWGTDDDTTATTVSFFADAGGDGAVRKFGSGGGWFATARAAATGDDAYPAAVNHYGCAADAANLLLQRGFYPFDTSSLPDGATITAASLWIYSHAGPSDGGGGSTANKSVAVVASTQASPTALTTADYDQVGSTEFATRIPVANFTSSAYHEIPLNATGLAAISKTGWTQLAIRMGYDLDNVAPTTDNVWIGSKFSDESGTSVDPYLTVTYH